MDTITIEVDPQGKPVSTVKPVKTKTVATTGGSTPGHKPKKSTKTDDDVMGAVLFIVLAFMLVIIVAFFVTRKAR
jgi:hypothetical protein